MEKKFEDEDLDKLIDEEFIREAQMMERALFSDGGMEDYEATEDEVKESYKELADQLKKDGVYREEETPDKVVSISGKQTTRHKLTKAAGFVLVSGMCVFAASMTSEANREYVVKHVGVLIGKDTRVITDNDEKNDRVNTDEYTARDDIEEKLGIEMPEFFYLPDTFEFHSYEVNPYAEFARIEYKYRDNIIEFGVGKVNESSKSKFDSIHGEELGTVTIIREDIEVQIKKIQDDVDELPNYLAQWKKDESLYYIVGKIEIEELSEMIKLIFY